MDMENPVNYMTGTETQYMEETVRCQPANMAKCYYDMADVALEKATRFFYIAEASAAYSGVQRMEYLKRVQEQPMDEAEEKLWFKDYVQKKQLFEDATLKEVWAMTVKAKRKAEEGIQGDKPNFRFYALGEDMAELIRSQILQKVREAVQYWTHDKQQLARKKGQHTENSFTVNDYRHVVKQMGQPMDYVKYSEKRKEWRSNNPEQKLARSNSRKSIPFATMEKARDNEKTELDNDEAVQVSQGGTAGVAAASKPESGSDTEEDDEAIQAILNKKKHKKRQTDSSLDTKPAAKKRKN